MVLLNATARSGEFVAASVVERCRASQPLAVPVSSFGWPRSMVIIASK